MGEAHSLRRHCALLFYFSLFFGESGFSMEVNLNLYSRMNSSPTQFPVDLSPEKFIFINIFFYILVTRRQVNPERYRRTGSKNNMVNKATNHGKTTKENVIGANVTNKRKTQGSERPGGTNIYIYI